MSTSTLFNRIKENVEIRRYNPVSGDEGIVGNTDVTPAEVYLEMYQGRNPRADIQNTGQVLEQGDFVGILMSPVAAIDDGDIVYRAAGSNPEKLNVTSVQTVLGIQQITLSEPGE